MKWYINHRKIGQIWTETKLKIRKKWNQCYAVFLFEHFHAENLQFAAVDFSPSKRLCSFTSVRWFITVSSVIKIIVFGAKVITKTCLINKALAKFMRLQLRRTTFFNLYKQLRWAKSIREICARIECNPSRLGVGDLKLDAKVEKNSLERERRAWNSFIVESRFAVQAVRCACFRMIQERLDIMTLSKSNRKFQNKDKNWSWQNIRDQVKGMKSKNVPVPFWQDHRKSSFSNYSKSSVLIFVIILICWDLNRFPLSFIYTLVVFPLECHEWSAAPISTYLRRGPRGCFSSGCCTGGESVAAPRLNCFIAPIHLINQAHEAGYAASTVSQITSLRSW